MFTSVTRILPIGRHGPTLRLIGGASGVSLCAWRKLLVISGNLHDEIKNDLPVPFNFGCMGDKERNLGISLNQSNVKHLINSCNILNII